MVHLLHVTSKLYSRNFYHHSLQIIGFDLAPLNDTALEKTALASSTAAAADRQLSSLTNTVKGMPVGVAARVPAMPLRGAGIPGLTSAACKVCCWEVLRFPSVQSVEEHLEKPPASQICCCGRKLAAWHLWHA